MEEKNQETPFRERKHFLERLQLPFSDKALHYDVMVKSMASGVR